MAYNFSSGPSMMPQEVLHKVHGELLNYSGANMSVMELCARTELFNDITVKSKNLLRDILHIPHNYHILFLHGGATSQFAMVPMNLLGENNRADYFETGLWSQRAIQEAKKYGDVNVVASGRNSKFTLIPEDVKWRFSKKTDYVYYVDNETVSGIEFPFIPDCSDVPLVSDMSSNFLSRPFDINKFGLVFACAQKNLGLAGVTIVVIKDDLVKEASSFVPTMFRYDCHVKHDSKFNTPPIFNWYVVTIMLQWIKDQGGLSVMASLNEEKSNKVYDFIDNSTIYHNSICEKYRSRMNVTFTLPTLELTSQFICEAKANKLYGLDNYFAPGTCRVGLYNSMPISGVDVLLGFMEDFEYKINKKLSNKQ